jgi:hypothetical protein
MVLKSGDKRLVSQISSTLRCVSRSRRQLDWMRFKYDHRSRGAAGLDGTRELPRYGCNEIKRRKWRHNKWPLR